MVFMDAESMSFIKYSFLIWNGLQVQVDGKD